MCLSVSACLSTPPDRAALLERALPAKTLIPAKWQAHQSSDTTVGDNWLASFADPQLVKIVAEALANNPDLQQVASTVLVMAAQVDVVGAQTLPHVGGKTDNTWGKDSGNATQRSNSQSLLLSWELDIWGRLRAQKDAAQADYNALALDYAYARQSLAATTAKSWFSAVEASRQLDLATQSTALYAELLKLSQIRQRLGKVPEFDVIQAQAALDSSQATRLAASNTLASNRRNLELLLGRYPAAEIAVASQSATLPPAAAIEAPLALLARRPDLLAAEQHVRSTFRLLEADRLALLPDFTFQLEVGRFQNQLMSLTDLNPWIAHSTIGMQIPIYEGGALVAQIRIADAQEQSAVAAYGALVLTAFNEVESGLSNEYSLSQRLHYVTQAVRSQALSVQLAGQRYKAGASDMQSLLQLQADELASENSAIGLRYALLNNRVNLNLALGGSFDATPVIPAGLFNQ